MQDPSSSSSSRPGETLALGFGTTIAVWTVAYLCRMPMVQAPAPATVLLMVATVFAGGVVAGRLSPRGAFGGLLAGLVCGTLLDLLILGGIYTDLKKSHPEYVAPAALLLWVGGSLLMVAGITGAGALVGAAKRPRPPRDVNWTGVLAWTLPAATLPLITAGGLVTAWGSGLAVPDWPNSFGYNMVLLPLSQMQGGVFYEHTHRLMGVLVGLTGIALTYHLVRTEQRGWVRTFAWIVLGAICVQGILGGLRVTGKFTTATTAAAMAPSTTLAIVHGIVAQVTFGLMAALACACTRWWKSDRQPEYTPAAQTDYVFTTALVALMVVQLVLGALLRHRNELLILHITNSVFVTLLALGCGVRAWGLYPDAGPLRRAGLVVVIIVFAQLMLGLAALIFRHPLAVNPTATHAVFTTLHQANGALLMAGCMSLLAWTFRCIRLPAPADVAAEI